MNIELAFSLFLDNKMVTTTLVATKAVENSRFKRKQKRYLLNTILKGHSR